MSSSIEKKPFKRLLSTIVPISYDLNLRPDLTKFTFEGLVKIVVDIREKKLNQFTLNAADLKISPDKSFIRFGDKVISLDITYDEEAETASFKTRDSVELPEGQALVVLQFTGSLNDKMKGFYRSKYTGPDGKVRWTAVTQFEPANARRAFPCFDEPSLKATFDISLTVPNDPKIIALSNMSQTNEMTLKEEDNLKMVMFARTPIMSTYLVAFVVGEFEHIETKSPDNVLVRVFAPIGKSHLGKFAMQFAVRALSYYKQYFQIAYPLDKLDLIAVSDFASGAMENWGLVTYREDCILVDEDNSSARTRQNVALVVAHELAHQWFGNLVTMEWWTHLWLNEGFASFIENLCVDEIFPNYNIWTQFVGDVFLNAMELDGLDNSHPIEVPVGHPSEVDEIFDDISYSKGASVIRMLHKYIGDDDFRKGMNLYLTKHSYRNTQTEDLWDSLEVASKKPVRRVMSTWTKQKGYPVITVGATFDPNNSDSCVISLSQEKFSLNGKLSDEDRNALWAVPISIITSSSNNKPVYEGLLESATLTLTLTRDQLRPSEWFKLNPSTTTMCRVRYSPELMSKFSESISNKSLCPLDRLGLSSDLFALVIAGQQSTVSLLRFLGSFRSETDYTVWSSLCSILYKLDNLFAHTDFYERYQKFVRELLNHTVFPSIGWKPKPSEPYLDTLLRARVISCLVNFDDEPVLAECRRLFNVFVADRTRTIPADIRNAVYRGVCSYASEETFNLMIEFYRQSNLQEEKYRISCALGWTQNVELLRRVLDFAITPEVVSSDSGYIISSVADNYVGRQMAWDFFVNNRQLFLDRYKGSCMVGSLITGLTESFNTEQRAKEVAQFFVENRFPGTERTVQQAVETIRINGAILRRDVDSVRSYLQSV